MSQDYSVSLTKILSCLPVWVRLRERVHPRAPRVLGGVSGSTCARRMLSPVPWALSWWESIQLGVGGFGVRQSESAHGHCTLLPQHRHKRPYFIGRLWGSKEMSTQSTWHSPLTGKEWMSGGRVVLLWVSLSCLFSSLSQKSVWQQERHIRQGVRWSLWCQTT